MPSEPGGLAPLPFSRIVDVRDIPPKGLSGRLSPDAAQRARIAAFLGVIALERFEFDYKITHLSGGGAHLQAELGCALIQACILTREPVGETIAEAISLRFRPDENRDKPFSAAEDFSFDGDDPDEPLIDGRIDIGALAVELLGVSMEPYPRAPGEEFTQPAENASAETNPFSILAKLKSSSKGRD